MNSLPSMWLHSGFWRSGADLSRAELFCESAEKIKPVFVQNLSDLSNHQLEMALSRFVPLPNFTFVATGRQNTNDQIFLTQIYLLELFLQRRAH